MRCCCAAPRGRSWPYAEQSALQALGPVDVAIALLHGPFGEDGTIQGLFEMMGTRYVGAGVLASAVGMDKHFTKLILAAHGLPVGPFVAITRGGVGPGPGGLPGSGCGAALPAVRQAGARRVQPRHQQGRRPRRTGAGDRPGSRSTIPRSSSKQGIVGARELECGVLADLDGGPPQASAVAEIRVHSESGFYDFEAKYLPEEQVDLDVPAAVDHDLAEQVRALAVRTFEAIECEGLARVDVFVTHDHRVLINEINTMPGFTPHSMFPRMWAASGVPYPELVERLITLALQRPLGLR